MDKRTIYSKTGKGSLEISKKSIKLASDERQALILVDGKSSLGDIEEKLSRVAPVRLRAILDRLVELDLIREFVTKQGPDSIMPSLGGPTAMKVEELDELDFTALMPAASSNTAKEMEDRRLADMQAEEAAAAARVAERQAQQQRDAEENARRQQAEAEQAAAARRQQQEAEARERARREEEAAIRARADAEAKARADAEARARAEADAKARAEEDARRRAEDEARRKAEEEARRRAEEESRRKAEEEARRKAAEEAERRQREEAERREREEAERREREEAERRERARREEEARRAAAAEEKRRREAEEAAQREREREAALRREREEQEQRAREEAQREAQRREREEAERRAAEEARQQAEREHERAEQEREREAAERKEADRRERRRREEEAKRAAIAEEKRQREQAESAAQRDAEEAERRAAEEAARYTAALTPQIDAVTSLPESNDLDFNSKGAPATGGIESLDLKPLAGGGPDTFADTGMTANSIFEADASDDDKEVKGKKSIEKEARRELEKEAKESAKAAAKAKKEAEREARRLAKESKVTIRRGGGSGFSLGKFIFIFIVLLIGGGIGYLYFMPVDKRLVESQASGRLGIPVKVGTAKFEPFPPQLQLTDVRLDDIVLPRVTAVPDPGSLAADRKIWNSIDVAGATLTGQQVRKLIGIFLQEAPAGASMTMQRVRITGLTVTGLPVALPPMDVNVLLAADGTARQATASLPDGKAQLQMAVDEKGWTVDFESRGVTWAVGPKTAWESVRAKGVAREDGVRFESIAFTHFGGTANGAGDLFWVNGWKFNGNLEVGGMESGSIAQAYYGAQPVSGTIDGKFKLAMSAPALPQLLDAAQIEGSVVVNKPAVNNIDLARSGQAGSLTPGTTRFSDFAADLALSGPKVQIKNIRATSGLLTVSGDVAIAGDKNLSGLLNIELGIASNRSKSALRVSGTPADPKLSK
jgi:hypothetical protein